MLDEGTDLGLLAVGSCDGLRHRLALRLLAMDLAVQAVPDHMLFVLRRAVSGIGPNVAGSVLLIDQIRQLRPVVAGGIRRPPCADQAMSAVDNPLCAVLGRL